MRSSRSIADGTTRDDRMPGNKREVRWFARIRFETRKGCLAVRMHFKKAHVRFRIVPTRHAEEARTCFFREPPLFLPFWIESQVSSIFHIRRKSISATSLRETRTLSGNHRVRAHKKTFVTRSFSASRRLPRVGNARIAREHASKETLGTHRACCSCH